MEEQNIPFLKRCSKIFKQILLLIYSCLAGGAGIYYLYLLSFHVKMSFGLTLITGLNFVLISLIGFTVLALRSPDGYKGYLAFIGFEILVIGTLLIYVHFWLKPSNTFQTDLEHKIKHYLEQPNQLQDIDQINESLDCCGVSSYRDYKLNGPGEAKYKFPASCCTKLNATNECDEDHVRRHTCLWSYLDEFRTFKGRIKLILYFSFFLQGAQFLF